jgi:hypothetical protein
MIFKVIATTPQEVKTLKSYLYKHCPLSRHGSPLDRLSSFKEEKEYLWVSIKDNYVESHQTVVAYKGSERDRIIKQYFTDTTGNTPLEALINPDNYPEYYI